MSAEDYLLDTSAWLTLIEDESGADRVDQILREAQVWIPWTVLLEVSYITRRERGEAEANVRYALMGGLGAGVLWEVDEPTLLTAARFKAAHRVSLADAMIAAYAQRKDATLLHKDPEYEVLAGELRLEALPYKRA